MTTELFPAESVTQDIPRLAWIKRHGFKAFKSTCVPDDEQPWNAWFGHRFDDPLEQSETWGFESLGTGNTEDEAVTNLALKHNIKLWNEEDFTQ